MKVLHIISGLGDGGAEGVLYRLCGSDISSEHTIVSLGDLGKYGPLLRGKGFNVYALNAKSNKFSFFLKLICIIRSKNPDIIQTWMYHADLVGGLAKIFCRRPKLVWGIRHGDLTKNDSKFSTRLIMRLCSIASRFLPDAIICCAASAKDIHINAGYDAGKMHVVPNGFDPKRFKSISGAREKIRSELGVPLDSYLIGMVARADPQKDHATFIEAARIVKKSIVNSKFLLVGRSIDASADIMKHLIESGLRDDFILVGSRPDIPEILNCLDVHVLTSRSGEGFPNVVAEALACGVPSIATNVGDSCDIVGRFGWCVHPMNAGEIASKVIEIWLTFDSSCREELISYVNKRFDLCSMIHGFHRVWRG